jgi:hypothetical protein
LHTPGKCSTLALLVEFKIWNPVDTIDENDTSVKRIIQNANPM